MTNRTGANDNSDEMMMMMITKLPQPPSAEVTTCDVDFASGCANDADALTDVSRSAQSRDVVVSDAAANDDDTEDLDNDAVDTQPLPDVNGGEGSGDGDLALLSPVVEDTCRTGCDEGLDKCDTEEETTAGLSSSLDGVDEHDEVNRVKMNGSVGVDNMLTRSIATSTSLSAVSELVRSVVSSNNGIQTVIANEGVVSDCCPSVDDLSNGKDAAAEPGPLPGPRKRMPPHIVGHNGGSKHSPVHHSSVAPSQSSAQSNGPSHAPPRHGPPPPVHIPRLHKYREGRPTNGSRGGGAGHPPPQPPSRSFPSTQTSLGECPEEDDCLSVSSDQQQYVVNVHVYPGETFSVCVSDQVQLIQGQ